jgi:hypothetical protein
MRRGRGGIILYVYMLKVECRVYLCEVEAGAMLRSERMNFKQRRKVIGKVERNRILYSLNDAWIVKIKTTVN